MLSGFQIDDQLELGGLLESGGLAPFRIFVNEPSSVLIASIRPYGAGNRLYRTAIFISNGRSSLLRFHRPDWRDHGQLRTPLKITPTPNSGTALKHLTRPEF